MIEVFKHINAYDKEGLSSAFKRRERRTRKHDFQLYERIPKDGSTGLKANSFYYRFWNELPVKVVNATSTDGFKNWIDD